MLSVVDEIWIRLHCLLLYGEGKGVCAPPLMTLFFRKIEDWMQESGENQA